MGERNDLIERLDGEIAAVMWKSRLGVDRVALKESCGPLTSEPVALWPITSVAHLLDTIARLSEALAEAEKKGAEARAKALEDAIEAIRTAAVTTTLSGDDAASFCNGADWMEGEAIKAIRDLSQGGQHG